MTIRNFFVGRAVGVLAVLAVLGIVLAYQSMNRVPGEEAQPPVANTPIDHPEDRIDGEADPARMTLGMKTWVWVSASSTSGGELRPGAGKEFSVAFGSDGKFSAKTDCNSMGGSYAADVLGGASAASTSKISFTQIFSTEMFCEGSQETEFASLLGRAEKYHFTPRGQLILGLKANGGSAVFR